MSIETHGRWPWASAALLPAAALAVFARRDWIAQDGRWVAALALPLLVAHQTEEWVWPGGFLRFANQRLLGSDEPTFPITERIGLVINVPLGWGTAAGGLLLWRRSPALAAGVLGLELGNVAMHGGMLLREGRYNPGAVSAIALFVPHVAAGGWWLAHSGRVTRGTVAAAAAAIASGLVVPAVLKRRGARHRRESRVGPRRAL
jgi:Protein of unknown function with HXXEE motif